MKALSFLSVIVSLAVLWLTHRLCSPIFDDPESEFIDRLPCLIIMVLHIYLAAFCIFITFKKSPYTDWLTEKEKDILEK
jgi:hypothetical protein